MSSTPLDEISDAALPRAEGDPALLRHTRSLAEQAGARILEIYEGSAPIEVTHKADSSPLTSADRAAHETIVSGLRALTPAIPVLSEESSDEEISARASWTLYWLVDPLDGTKEFLKRNGEFTVNIALVRAHEPVLGVVHAPVLGLTYYAARGLGAWKAQPGAEPLQIRVRPQPRVPTVVGSRSHRGASLDRLLAELGPHELRTMGSSLKLCLVADGSADLYPRFGPTSEWDTAAAHAVVNEAGGQVLAADSLQPLRYNTRLELLNPHFIVIGDCSADWGALMDNASRAD